MLNMCFAGFGMQRILIRSLQIRKLGFNGFSVLF